MYDTYNIYYNDALYNIHYTVYIIQYTYSKYYHLNHIILSSVIAII